MEITNAPGSDRPGGETNMTTATTTPKRTWFKGEYSRDEAIKIAGLAAVEKVESENCEPTSRCMPWGQEDYVEFSASVKWTDADGDRRHITVYYYQDTDICNETEDMGDLTWEPMGYDID